MNTLLRMTIWSGVLYGFFIVSDIRLPRWISESPWGFGNISEPIKQIRHECARAEELENLSKSALHCLQERSAVVDEVYAGKIGLLEAAARFKTLGSEGGIDTKTLKMFFRGETDTERTARQVLRWAQSRARNYADSKTVLARLENELETHLRKGNFHLVGK